ncbi:GreA/GreB family elongation factor [Flavobacteriaceae bacterium]|nr:GreA/GreB family elongation factor [Flavobacteriaceae bacterium]
MIKKTLFDHCKAHLEKKMGVLEQQKKSLQKDLTSETKSSAGDKHETGRAMIQLEREKLGNQIREIELNYQRLNTIKDVKTSTIISLGSIIFTDKANYFIAIAADFCEVNSKVFYCISSQSPIGKLLIGKKINESIMINNIVSTILKII